MDTERTGRRGVEACPHMCNIDAFQKYNSIHKRDATSGNWLFALHFDFAAFESGDAGENPYQDDSLLVGGLLQTV